MTYVTPLRHQRSDAERADPALAWQRSDEAFFASGACHILAFTFRELHPERDLTLRFIDPATGFPGTHLYVVERGWAFDFDGWTREDELLAVTEEAWRGAHPGWSCEVGDIDTDLETFCADHLHRPPGDFARDPRPRARAFIARLPASP